MRILQWDNGRCLAPNAGADSCYTGPDITMSEVLRQAMWTWHEMSKPRPEALAEHRAAAQAMGLSASTVRRCLPERCHVDAWREYWVRSNDCWPPWDVTSNHSWRCPRYASLWLACCIGRPVRPVIKERCSYDKLFRIPPEFLDQSPDVEYRRYWYPDDES